MESHRSGSTGNIDADPAGHSHRPLLHAHTHTYTASLVFRVRVVVIIVTHLLTWMVLVIFRDAAL